MGLYGNQLTSMPAEIGQLMLASLPAEIGQLTDLSGDNQLTSVPAEIGQLMSLRVLSLTVDELAGRDAARRRTELYLSQTADERAGGDRAAHVADGVVPPWQSADERAGGDRAAHVAEGVEARLSLQELTSLLTSMPAEIGQLTSLVEFELERAAIWQLASLTSVPAEIYAV